MDRSKLTLSELVTYDVKELCSNWDTILAKIPRWISVDEQMPPWGDMVIVRGGCAFWDGQWRTSMEAHWPPIQWEVTHWMSFPSDPPNVT